MKNLTKEIQCASCGEFVKVKLEPHGETRLGTCPNCGAISSHNRNSAEISSWKSILAMIITLIMR